MSSEPPLNLLRRVASETPSGKVRDRTHFLHGDAEELYPSPVLLYIRESPFGPIPSHLEGYSMRLVLANDMPFPSL